MKNNLNFFLNTLHENNFEGFLVGGCVRDMLLKREPDDYDITTNATPEEIQKIFKKTFLTGEKYGTVTVIHNDLKVEITTYRIDGEYLNNRKPKEIQFTNKLNEDLKRRDFTINAMCFNEEDGLVDLFSGKNDLENKIIRTVGNPDERFLEDALRMLRAIRFSVKLGFSIEEETFLSIQSNAKLISNISYERIYQELFKMFQINPLKSVQLLIKSKLLFYINNNFIISKKSIELLGDIKGFQTTMAILLHDNPNYKEILTALKLSNEDKKRITTIINGINLKIEPTKKGVKNAIYTLHGNDCFLDILNIKGEQKLIELYDEIIKNNECYCLRNLALSGDDLIELGVKKELIGEILNAVLLKVINEEFKNE